MPAFKPKLKDTAPKPLCPYCENPDRTQRPSMQEDLRFPCGNPDCPGHIVYPDALCHPGRGLDVEYCERHGVLCLACHVCRSPLSTLLIARLSEVMARAKNRERVTGEKLDENILLEPEHPEPERRPRHTHRGQPDKAVQ